MKREGGLKVKKKPIIIGATAILLVVAGYFGAGSYYEDKFLPNTMLDGIDISNDTVAQAKAETTAAIAQTQIQIVENGENIYAFSPADFGVSRQHWEVGNDEGRTKRLELANPAFPRKAGRNRSERRSCR